MFSLQIYIFGFLMWNSLIKRLLTLITNSAQLIAENQALKKQAELATRADISLIHDSKEAKKSEVETKWTEDSDLLSVKKINEQEIRLLNENLRRARKDLAVLKKQVDSAYWVYKNMLQEHAEGTAKLKRLENVENENEPGSKKEN